MIGHIFHSMTYAPKTTALGIIFVVASGAISSLAAGFDIVDTTRMAIAYVFLALAWKMMVLTILALLRIIDLPARPFTAFMVFMLLMIPVGVLVFPVMEKIRPDLFASSLHWHHDV